jgi:hypothetical protein
MCTVTPFTVAIFSQRGGPGPIPCQTCGIYGVQNGKDTRFTLSASVFPGHFHSILLPRTLHTMLLKIKFLPPSLTHSLTLWPKHVHRIHVVRSSYCKQGTASSDFNFIAQRFAEDATNWLIRTNLLARSSFIASTWTETDSIGRNWINLHDARGWWGAHYVKFRNIWRKESTRIIRRTPNELLQDGGGGYTDSLEMESAHKSCAKPKRNQHFAVYCGREARHWVAGNTTRRPPPAQAVFARNMCILLLRKWKDLI